MFGCFKNLFFVRKKDYKELAKYSFDISKIMFALALLAPLLKGDFYISAFVVYVGLFTCGIILLRKGDDKDE